MATLVTLIEKLTLAPGEESRLYPHWHGMDVQNYDRLHIHLGTLPGTGISLMNIRVLFATTVEGDKVILADSTVWFDDTIYEREFEFTVPGKSRGSGIVLSVPVIAPELFDIILINKAPTARENLYLTLMTQEI